MNDRNALRNGPGHIPLPPNAWNDESALLTDTPEEPSSRDPNPFSSSTFSPPQWSAQHHFGIAGDEPPDIPDKPPIPVAIQMSSVAGVTPLPLLPMTVLSIVSRRFRHPLFLTNMSKDDAWRVFICQCVGSMGLVYGQM